MKYLYCRSLITLNRMVHTNYFLARFPSPFLGLPLPRKVRRRLFSSLKSSCSSLLKKINLNLDSMMNSVAQLKSMQ